MLDWKSVPLCLEAGLMLWLVVRVRVGVGVGVGVSLDPGCGSRDVSGGAQVAVSLSGFAHLSLGLTVH